jgi:hypothetical protein
MIGFNLLQDIKKNPGQRDELIAKALEEIEKSAIDSGQVAKKEDLKILELKIAEAEIRIINKMQMNTWSIIMAIGAFGVLNHWLFR